MISRKKLVTLESMNQNVRNIRVPILGSLSIRAVEIQREIEEGIHKPFGKLTACHLGDLQATGQKPITFLRQVAALCTYPDLLEMSQFPEDAKRRARAILKDLNNGSIGSYNQEYIDITLPCKIADFIKKRDGVEYPCDPRNIIVSGGTSQAIVCVLSMVVNNEEALKTGIMVSVPYYPIYADAVALCEAVKVQFELDEEDGWSVNVTNILRSLHAARKHCNPKVLCVINPGNPTGHVLSRDRIEDLIRLAAEENLLLFADEVYQENIFGPGAAFHSFKKVLYEMGPHYSERVQLVSFNSISKGISGECGLRAGYIEFVNIDPSVFEILHMLKSFYEPPVTAVLMMDVILDPPQPGDQSYETFIAEKQALLGNLAEKAQLTEQILNRAAGIHCNPIQGAMYAFPRIQIPEPAVRLAQSRCI
ncbi:alanine aminotransferase 2-like isoform X2 [Mixophyes fleayi]|uniref:alanine aminotransferase 2-like isoform X2 n=1 Tax=Mixophyes fleayi TaxID=3061075 RepID=UPI003F4D8ACB